MTVHGVSDGFGKTLAALFLGSGLFLTGCSGPSGPVPATERGATATAPATATPGPAEAARPSAPATVTDVYISTTSIEVRDASGETLATFDYFQPARELVAGLTTAFGSAPLTETIESNHPGTSYTWGQFTPGDPGTGQALSTRRDFVLNDEEQAAAPPFYPNTFVVVSAEAVNGIHISTVDGIAVGDNATEIAARYPDTSQLWGTHLDIDVDLVPLPPAAEGPPGSGRTLSVRLRAPDAGLITGLVAPSPNVGA